MAKKKKVIIYIRREDSYFVRREVEELRRTVRAFSKAHKAAKSCFGKDESQMTREEMKRIMWLCEMTERVLVADKFLEWEETLPKVREQA